MSELEEVIGNTNWDDPVSSFDWNNLAVIDLINADQEEDLQLKTSIVAEAKAKLERGFALDQNLHCASHYILIQSILGEDAGANSLTLHTVVNMPQTTEYEQNADVSLIYLPALPRGTQEFELMLKAESGYQQANMFLAEVIRRSQFIFYNSFGTRFLKLANQIFHDSSAICLMLGVTHLMANQSEGVAYLQHGRKLAPENPAILQGLYLAYRGFGDLGKAKYWMEQANALRLKLGRENASWQWTSLLVDETMTYVSFDEDVVMAVEPNFKSIVTSVLIAQGDWFEREIEFWRDNIQGGMTIIDVGANAGVYAFSAAKRVGATGRVLAIEPFSACVNYLNETCRVNQFDWVNVCAGAASDRIGKAKLSVGAASELNEVVADDSVVSGSFEEVDCFTLDSLLDKYDVKRVDFLKIDAEGHELQVLKGSDRLLQEFSPIILYENIAGAQGSNLPVADYLREHNYKLFRYQPYLKNLVPIEIGHDFQGSLNIIAVPQ
ncbi:FkbM family methyltransferase [Pseudanabaena galeata]|uniref:FkbM family methyltransferase n=1 Tax=Pseudanabaena galeata TaxID=1112103 RepID=UPI00247AD8F0|nr:FkbM family methyltransferase [Pseudanabaena galeata]WGS70982.1 FkbM family methyltransferase [Pseudanabaena galeata CCNP1313]